MPIPAIIRKPKNGIMTGGRSSSGNDSSPISRAFQLPEAIMLPSFGTEMANKLRSCADPGWRSKFRMPAVRLPPRFDRGEFGRLMREHILAREMPEKKLHRNDHGDQSQPPMQHHARLGAMHGPQHIPGPVAMTHIPSSEMPRAACAASAPA